MTSITVDYVTYLLVIAFKLKATLIRFLGLQVFRRPQHNQYPELAVLSDPVKLQTDPELD